MARPAVVLVGPQRHHPSVVDVIASLKLRGPFGLITAGWQRRESEEHELRAAVGGEWVNLQLYQRYEDVRAADAELTTILRNRQEKLRTLQGLYRLRLTSAVTAARALLSRRGDAELLDPERDDAIEAIRALDRHHLSRVAAITREADVLVAARKRPLLVKMQRELKQSVMDVEAVLVAGGHVAVLLNRMRLFGLESALRSKLVIAWSAGAMVLSERIVLFHDSPPQGPGNAELLDRGLGLFRGVLPLPDGSTRLDLGDKQRVRLLAERFDDLRPVLLDPLRRLDWKAPNWAVPDNVEVLTASGESRRWRDL